MRCEFYDKQRRTQMARALPLQFLLAFLATGAVAQDIPDFDSNAHCTEAMSGGYARS
jgi:hypothetical protein